MHFILLDILGVKRSKKIYYLLWQWKFLFWEVPFPPLEKEKRRKIPVSRNTQKASAVWSATSVFLPALLHLHVLSLCAEHLWMLGEIQGASTEQSCLMQGLWHIRLHLDMQSTHQAPHLHLQSKSQVICACSSVTGSHWSPLVDVSFCLKNGSWRGRAHFWILKVGKHDRFAETLVKIAGSQCQSM